eukprot:RCo006530
MVGEGEQEEEEEVLLGAGVGLGSVEEGVMEGVTEGTKPDSQGCRRSSAQLGLCSGCQAIAARTKASPSGESCGGIRKGHRHAGDAVQRAHLPQIKPRGLPVDHLQNSGPEAPNVRGGAVAHARDHLRGHPEGCPSDGDEALGGSQAELLLGAAEVGQLDPPFRGDQDV